MQLQADTVRKKLSKTATRNSAILQHFLPKCWEDHPHEWHDLFQEGDWIGLQRLRFCYLLLTWHESTALAVVSSFRQEYEAMMRRRTDQFLENEGVTAEQAVEECHSFAVGRLSDLSLVGINS